MYRPLSTRAGHFTVVRQAEHEAVVVGQQLLRMQFQRVNRRGRTEVRFERDIVGVVGDDLHAKVAAI